MSSARADDHGEHENNNGNIAARTTGAGRWQNHLHAQRLSGTISEAAVAGAAEVGRVGRRLLHKFWDAEPINTKANMPVWCLGCRYSIQDEGAAVLGRAPTSPSQGKGEEDSTSLAIDQVASASSTTPNAAAGGPGSSSVLREDSRSDGGWPVGFLDDFESRVWMTYRTEFPVIPKSTDPAALAALSLAMRLKTSFGDQAGFSSDTGWGCMIRSGQSLLANAISISRLGRDWRRNRSPDAEKEIIALFADDPRAPYSLHNFVKHGAAACSKHPGEWFGPSATARCIEALTNQHEDTLRVYSCPLPEVYEDSFMAVANPGGHGFQSTLILVGTRLGIDKINCVYEEALLSTLQMPQAVGIAGGRPSSSLYFVGTQGKWLFYLDPHHPRPALVHRKDPSTYSRADLESCHTRRLRHLHVGDMDPSMLIGFLIRNADDWEQWKSSVKHVQGKAIITVSPSDPAVAGVGIGRAEAIDEIETLSDDNDDTTPESRAGSAQNIWFNEDASPSCASASVTWHSFQWAA